jgi:hypothetical protein
MEKIIACCGLNCSGCPAFIATQKNDYGERVKVAKEWSEMYKIEFKQEDINCDGCLAVSGRQIPYCSTCEIRKCVSEKKFANCAYCNDYPCTKLSSIDTVPEAKDNLERIKKSLIK